MPVTTPPLTDPDNNNPVTQQPTNGWWDILGHWHEGTPGPGDEVVTPVNDDYGKWGDIYDEVETPGGWYGLSPGRNPSMRDPQWWTDPGNNGTGGSGGFDDIGGNSGGADGTPLTFNYTPTNYTAQTINPADYMQNIPDELKQYSQEGYGQNWISAMFKKNIEGIGQDYARGRDQTNFAMARSGFDKSGFVNRQQDKAKYQYTNQANDVLGSIEEANQTKKLDSQAQVQDIELQNQGMTEAINDWNNRQQLAENSFGWYQEQTKALREAQIEAAKAGETGSNIGNSLQLGAAGFSALGPWGLALAGIPWIDDIFKDD